MNAATAYKVHVKLGQSEFSAEGPEETVKQQLANFLELASAHSDSPSNGHRVATANNSNVGKGQSPPANQFTGIDQETVNRLFTEDGKGVISLRVLPKTEDRNADALLLILFGYLILKDQKEVKAKDLLAGAKQSGIALERIDKVLDRWEQLVTNGGIKKGSWYSLTNPGIEAAGDLANRIFG